MEHQLGMAGRVGYNSRSLNVSVNSIVRIGNFFATAAKEELIIFICLASHPSHVLQPLDLGIFKLLKQHWRDILLGFFVSQE